MRQKTILPMHKSTTSVQLSTRRKRTKTDWLRVVDLPISRTLTDRLIAAGVLEAYTPRLPGAQRAIKFVSMASFDAWVRSGAVKAPRSTPPDNLVEAQAKEEAVK